MILGKEQHKLFRLQRFEFQLYLAGRLSTRLKKIVFRLMAKGKIDLMIKQHLHQLSIGSNRHFNFDLRLSLEKRGYDFRDSHAGRRLRRTNTYTPCLPI
ncbi:hypothetical protein D3C73_1286080 [compost metagenome]